ncbi:MAG TPA: SDR family oxidoreductase, partial [Sphingobium sp.]
MIDLEGKIALITGAASGIGREIARVFHELGAILVLTDINRQGLKLVEEELGKDVLTRAHDVAAPGDWVEVFANIAQRHGRLDILVNNAGIMVAQPFAQAGIDVLRRELRINVESVYLGMHGALPLLRAALDQGAKTTSIVNIAS